MSSRKPPEDSKQRLDPTNHGNHHADLSLGSRLKMARMAAKLSGNDVTQKVEVSRQSVSYWELDRSEPRPERLGQLAKLYNVRLEWLRSGRGPMREPPIVTADEAAAEETAREAKARERQRLLLDTLQTLQKTTFAVARISINHDDISIDIVSPDQHVRQDGLKNSAYGTHDG